MTPTKVAEFNAFLYAEIAKRSDIPAESITAETQLSDIGLQSIDAVLLCGDLEDHFQVEIDPSHIFEHDTVGSFAQSILASLSS